MLKLIKIPPVVLLLTIALLPRVKVYSQSNKPIAFEVSIFGNEAAMVSGEQVIITEKLIRVIRKGINAGDKDSTIFQVPTPVNDTILKFSAIDLSDLKGYYANKCVEDGLQLTVIIKKDGKTKSVFLSHYYLDAIGPLITMFNRLVPEDLGIVYDRGQLIAAYNECNGN